MRRVVWDYPTHGFVIDYNEANLLGLSVSELDKLSVSLCEKVLSSNSLTAVELPDDPINGNIGQDEETGSYTGEKYEHAETRFEPFPASDSAPE